MTHNLEVPNHLTMHTAMSPTSDLVATHNNQRVKSLPRQPTLYTDSQVRMLHDVESQSDENA